jgi:hypothetical protein
LERFQPQVIFDVFFFLTESWYSMLPWGGQLSCTRCGQGGHVMILKQATTQQIPRFRKRGHHETQSARIHWISRTGQVSCWGNETKFNNKSIALLFHQRTVL